MQVESGELIQNTLPNLQIHIGPNYLWNNDGD